MRIFDIGGGDGPEAVQDRIWTIPNALSLLRLLALPVVYYDLVNAHYGRAFVVLAVFASTDWLDGYLARRLDQVSRVGKLLDPLSDRLLIAVVGIGLIVADIVPWWAIVILVARDVALLLGATVFLSRGIDPPPVTRVGKAATFGLMFALPMFILGAWLGTGADDPHEVWRGLAWLTYWTNTLLYYIAAGQYLTTVLRDRAALGADRRG
ncbi:MAG TPA: CDP-alcohol phosphatidyltransferase family protein [Nitriliruptorales bacterium]